MVRTRPPNAESVSRSRGIDRSSTATSARMPDGDLGGVPADDPAAEHDDLRGVHAGDPAEQDPGAALVLHQVVGADLGGEPPGDLAHGGEQRQRAVGQLHGLVGDGRGPGREQRVGRGAVGGEVQVGEQDEVVAQVAVLGRHGFLDLADEVGAPPDLGGVGEDRRAGGGELLVGDGRARRRRRPGPAPGARTRPSWCTPAGVSATRYSWFLTSLGMPTFMVVSVRAGLRQFAPF